MKRPALPPLPPQRPNERPTERPSSGSKADQKGRPPSPSVRPSNPSRPFDLKRPEGRNPPVSTPSGGRPFTRPSSPERPSVERPTSAPNKGDGDSIRDPLGDDFGRKPTARPRPGSGDRPSIISDLNKSDRRDRSRRDLISTDSNPISPKLNGDRIGGVKMKPAKAESVVVSGSTTIVNDNSVNYITNITYKNASWGGHHHKKHWSKPWHGGWCAPVWGPGACWNGWDHDGFSFGLGFGSGGFSFSLFYSNWGAPLHSSYCDPWWDGWCGSVVVHCPPRYRWCRPCWSPCGSWYTNYVTYRHVPASWCTPVYAWTPTCAVPAVTTINNNYYYDTTPAVTSTVYVDPQPATTVVTSLPPTSTAEVEAWDLLSNGFPRSSADSFAQLHDANPNNSRALVGYAISLAMLEDIGGASTVMRQALAEDPSLVAVLPLSQQLVERVRLLENSAEVAARQNSMARDALFLLGSWRAMQGRFTEAHLALLNAQASGEDSLAAARLRSWLEGRMTSMTPRT